MTSFGFTASAAAFVATYLIHSCCLVAAAMVVDFLIGRPRSAAREIIWRTALIGPLATVTLQILIGINPIGGILELASSTRMDALPPAVASSPEFLPASAGQVGGSSVGVMSPDAVSTGRAPLRDTIERNLPAVLGGIWLLGAGVALSRISSARRRLRRLMHGRKRRPVGRFVRRIARSMGLRLVPRVSTSEAFAAPFATGLRHPEICLPDRILTDLAPAQIEGLLAHEVAHLSRNDPRWRLVCRVIEGLFFFQPLNRFARKNLEELSEILSDARAVTHTGDRLGLADCLVDIASWTTENQPNSLAAIAAAKGPSITRRVDHLLSGLPEDTTMPKFTLFIVSLVIFIAAVAIPTVAPQARVAPVEPEAPVASTAIAAEPAPPAYAVAPAAVAPVAAPADVPSPAPQAVPAASAVPAPPNVDEETVALEMKAMRNHRIQRRLVELQERRAALPQDSPEREKELAELAELEAQLRAEIEASRAEAMKRAEERAQRGAEARDRDRASMIEEQTRRRLEREEMALKMRKEAEERAHRRDRERAERHEWTVRREAEHRERAFRQQEEALRQQEKEVREQAARSAQQVEHLERRLKALEDRERQLLEREKALEDRERALKKSGGEPN